MGITVNNAYMLLKKYNKEMFHLRHGITVGAVMNYFAKKLGFTDELEKWTVVGILHDLDFEMYPEEHCIKCVEIMKENDIPEDIIHAVVSHGYGDTVDVKPEHIMEKVLFAVDELTGLIYATSLMRPSKSVKDLEVKSVKKKFKDKKFAAGCDREVIRKGAEMLEMQLEELIEETILAMRESEDIIEEFLEKI